MSSFNSGFSSQGSSYLAYNFNTGYLNNADESFRSMQINQLQQIYLPTYMDVFSR